MSAIANWAADTDNGLIRPIMERVAGIDRNAELPKFRGQTFEKQAKVPATVDTTAPAKARKVVLFATCFANYNSPEIGVAAQVLARNGVETEVVYPGCCGMPQLEQGDLSAVAESAKTVSKELGTWIDKATT